MTTRGTLVLLAVLVVVGGWLALELRPRPTAPAGAEPLLATRPSVVATLEVTTSDRTLAAVRRGDDWADADGRPWPATVVADVVDTLTGLHALMVVDSDPSDAAQYGLAPATVTRVRLAATDGSPLLDLELGERNPAGTGVYVRRAGRPEVLLVGAILAWELDKLLAAAPSRTTLDQ